MADFFNPKEEVLHVELTHYGITKMKSGNLNPCYYTFHDDDIYYGDSTTDALYAELKKDDYNRIYKDTCYVRNFKTNTIEHSYYNISSPLGTSKRGVKNAPNIEVVLYDEEISFVPEHSSSTGKTFPTPLPDGSTGHEHEVLSNDKILTLNLGEVEYLLEAKELIDYDFTNVENNLNDVLGEYSTKIFPDQTFIKLSTPDILFSFIEDNVDSDFDNFDIEMYVKNSDTSEEYFSEILQEPKYEENIIENEILFERDNSEDIENFRRTNVGTNTASEYFLIEVDEEIPQYIMEKYFKNKNTSASAPLLPLDPVSTYNDTLPIVSGGDCE